MEEGRYRIFPKNQSNGIFHQLQVEDFLQAISEGREPIITGEEGRKTVEIFTAIYRSQRDRTPVKFPLPVEVDRSDFDGRLK